MKSKIIAAATLAFLPSIALAQQAPNPMNKAIDDAQRPDKYQGTTAASPPVPSSDQPPPTTDPRNDSGRIGPGFQGQPHGTGGVPKTIPEN